MRDVNSVLEMVQRYAGEGMIILLFLVALIFLLGGNRKKDTQYIVWLIFFSVLLVFNDVSQKILALFTDKETFYRFLWAVPVLLVIGYVFVKEWQKFQGKAVKATVLFLCVFLFLFGSDSYLTKENITYPGTVQKIPGDVKQVCEIINNNKQAERPVCVSDLSILLMIRSEEPSVVWGFTRQKYLDVVENGYDRPDCRYPSVETLVKVVNDGMQVPKKKLKKALKKRKVEFIVVKKEFQMTDYFAKIGVLPVGESDNYVVYQYLPKQSEKNRREA